MSKAEEPIRRIEEAQAHHNKERSALSLWRLQVACNPESIAAILSEHKRLQESNAALREALALAHDVLESVQLVHGVTSLPLAIERFGSAEACSKFSRGTWGIDVPKAIAESRAALNDTKGD